MARITREKLEVILRKHKLWLEDEPDGERADLRGEYLRGANLRGADLRGADLRGAYLSEADLRGADLRGAYLRGANLSEADLRGANLSEADLRGADLREADLREAYLREADLSRANLIGADLREADLRGADLRGADLSRANLDNAENLVYPIACPERGAFVAFKKARNGTIVELLIPEDARRSSATSRKCRCDKAVVLSITLSDGTDIGLTSTVSDRDPNFIYTVGKIVSVDNFDPDRWNECAPGIHFFITRQEAVDY